MHKSTAYDGTHFLRAANGNGSKQPCLRNLTHSVASQSTASPFGLQAQIRTRCEILQGTTNAPTIIRQGFQCDLFDGHTLVNVNLLVISFLTQLFHRATHQLSERPGLFLLCFRLNHCRFVGRICVRLPDCACDETCQQTEANTHAKPLMMEGTNRS